ncbi:GNAT family N-acetyltransferase [Blastopirellula sp. JC732]|uniref:GNAT family N-acetyltransferase n=1 Tax=Blastopirellula sediminis TaxID=2894196 RepID=A0A9X1SJH1_9BACT|nr:GNAT family N-acetyltransferase [Blastopirellula sediminis]MCC9604755.1 GNAT family N-acetyltransferase [Blastopirellula sediminis]MCC9631946.1 GNAT family N-acetyltransferase [Blastopirellula sediminis]
MPASSGPAPFAGQVVLVDLHNEQHAAELMRLLELYALDVMGGGKPLLPEVHEHLIERLKNFPTFVGMLAVEDGQYVGLANGFYNFSTFSARPVINVHDLAVDPDHRGRGVGKALLDEMARYAAEQGCSYLTLEVRADNPARRLYQRCGFVGGDPQADEMAFWKKRLI